MINKSNSRVLELTIISGESLTLAGKRPIKKNTYAVVKVESTGDQFTTAIDADNGSHPFWSHKLLINMPMHAKFFTLEVRCKHRSGDRLVGSARVPVTDFTRWCFPVDYLHFLSYRLRDGGGDRNGVINVSVKVKSPENGGGGGGDGGSAVCASPATGWRYDGATVGQGVVIGVPFGYSYCETEI